MSVLIDQHLPAHLALQARRQVDTGTVFLRRGQVIIGFGWTEIFSQDPAVSLEHWLLRPGRAPSQTNDTRIDLNDPQHSTRDDFNDYVRGLFPSEASTFTYDAVLCLSKPGIPDGGIGGVTGNLVAKARVLYDGNLAGFVYVHAVPAVPGRLVEHWALMPGYAPPSSGHTVTLADPVSGADNDVINANSPDAFLQAMHSRQGNDTWTWVQGLVTRTYGIPL